MSAPHVLVAEDEVLAAMALEFAMKREGWRVTLAGDGEAALRKALADAPDALVTDLRMPRRDGLWLIGEIRRERPGIPVVVMTGFVDRGAEEGLAADGGPTTVIEKPVDPAQLIRRLRELMEEG